VKRGILIVFVLLFAVSASGQAQRQNAAEARDAQTSRLRVSANDQSPKPNVAQAVYIKWRQEAPADEVSKLRFALATVTRRNGAGEAEVEFWVVGRTPQSVFEIRPLHFEKLPNGGFIQEQIGEIKESVVESSGEGDSFGMGMVFPVSPNTNALEIKLIGYDGGKLRNSTTVHVLLRDEPSENLTRITDSQ
jgi:hypothetical protein